MAPVASAAAADDGGSVVLPPTRYTASACAGKTPIVVASDMAAQSDLYSAVTLAGVVGTDCVVLAGARGESWHADQRARLDAADADGYVVGGFAAVPSTKVAGLSLKRVAGANRWETARLVGNEARSLAGSGDVDSAASVGAEDPTTDCTGDVPIVVASDAAAQSDLYSAVTLAGVIGSDCIVPAGDRDNAMPAAQQARLNAAAEGGYVVGGLAAVPNTKVAGRDMTRLAGTDRWETAQFVGRLASGDRTVGTSTEDEADSSDMPAEETSGLDEGFTSVTVGDGFSCGLRIDGTITCWGSDWWRQVTDVPAGAFAAIDSGGWHVCGLRRDGRIICWGYNTSDTNRIFFDDDWSNRAPDGTFAGLSAGRDYSCGLRTNGTVSCWGKGSSAPPSGTYTAVSAGFDNYGCGIRTGGSVVCWGTGWRPSASEFSSAIAISASNSNACVLRSNGQVECGGPYSKTPRWGPLASDSNDRFVDIATYTTGACGVQTDGSIECWKQPHWQTHSQQEVFAKDFEALTPVGAYAEVDVMYPFHACAVNRNGRVKCWGDNNQYQSSPQIRVNPALGFERVIGHWSPQQHACGVRKDGTAACWGLIGWMRIYPQWTSSADLMPHNRLGSRDGVRNGASDVKSLYDHRYWFTEQIGQQAKSSWFRLLNVVHYSDKSVRLFAGEEDYWASGEERQYLALDVILTGSFDEIEGPCGLRTNGIVACWNHLGAIVEQWPGTYRDLGGICGVRENGSIACHGLEPDDEAEWSAEEIPSGTFLSVVANSLRACGIRTTGSIACWGDWAHWRGDTLVDKDAKPPSGKFIKVSISQASRSYTTGSPDARACGIRANGTLACWGDWDYFDRWDREWIRAEPPGGTFIDVEIVDASFGCGVTTNTEVECWGHSEYPIPPPVH